MRGISWFPPKSTTPVASILVKVVPSLLARTPPTRGVHVLFKENAEMRRENSVLSVPISLDRRDLSGPSMYEALEEGSVKSRRRDEIQVSLGDLAKSGLTNRLQITTLSVRLLPAIHWAALIYKGHQLLVQSSWVVCRGT